jgi:hypothetical protein
MAVEIERKFLVREARDGAVVNDAGVVAGDSFRSVALITAGTPGLPPGLALRPGSQCPWLVRSTIEPPFFGTSSGPPRRRRDEQFTRS